MYRKAIHANSWYPGNREKLEKMIKNFEFTQVIEKFPAKAVIVPHAGYVYSGATAQNVFGNIQFPETALILSPNHRNIGKRASIMVEGSWETPFGDLEINSSLAKKLLEGDNLLMADEEIHKVEHSVELELPLLKYNAEKEIQIVPLTLKQLKYEECSAIAGKIANLLREGEDDFLLVASTDFSHGETLENTTLKDEMAIREILKLDSERLYKTVNNNNISMCGYIPVTIILKVAELMGWKTARLISQTNSARISGNYDYIVGYAGFVIF